MNLLPNVHLKVLVSNAESDALWEVEPGKPDLEITRAR